MEGGPCEGSFASSDECKWKCDDENPGVRPKRDMRAELIIMLTSYL